MRSAVLLLVAGVLLVPGVTQAKGTAVKGATQVPCTACHLNRQAAKAPERKVACSSCHLDFTAGALHPAADAHKREVSLKKEKP